MGLSGRAKCYYFNHPLSWNWDSVLFSHEFLIVTESPSLILGRDILSKVQVSIFINMEPALSLPLIEQNVNPKVWADGKIVDQTQNAVPVFIKCKDPHLFPHQKQYPLKPEIKEGLKPITENLKDQGQLIPCNSPCNTPILGVKKSSDEWRLIQDLWIINEAVVAFIHTPKTNGFSCLQVWVDTFTWWIKAFPCDSEQAKEVIRILIHEIIPRFGLPWSLQSDNGSAFKTTVTQWVLKSLGIVCHLHWRSQSSGEVEKINDIIKKHLRKLTQEIQDSWLNVLPIALMRAWTAPKKKGLSPFEYIYGSKAIPPWTCQISSAYIYGRPFLHTDIVIDPKALELTMWLDFQLPNFLINWRLPMVGFSTSIKGLSSTLWIPSPTIITCDASSWSDDI